MELFLTIAIWLGLVYGIYAWAESKGRMGLAWGAVAALLSPLLVGIVLLFVPKTLEKQAEEAKRLKSLMQD
jgi:hypothetical protein